MNLLGEDIMSNTFMRILPGMEPPVQIRTSSLVKSEDFTSENHTELDQLYFATDDKEVLAGVWECAPCKEEIDSYPAHEMMTVISGSVTLTNKEGASDTFTAGDVFFIPKGTQCTWHITEKLRKVYMIVG
jgi:uncharacterized cupin superfamily protein